jgi:maleate isomerase
MKPAFNYGTRARLGLLLPSGNQAAEPQLQAMLPAGVSLHTTRLKLMGSSERELLGLVERVEEAAELAADVEPDLIVFHCTAVSTFSRELEASILERIRKAHRR